MLALIQFPTKLALFLSLIFAAGFTLGIPASAGTQQNITPVLAAKATTASVYSVDNFFRYIRTQQRLLNRKLAKSVLELKRNGSPSAAYTLILASLLYGFFHAAGPGHGKAIISGYLLASRQTIKRGIALAFAASFLQAISAILIVMVLSVIMKSTGVRISQTIGSVTRISYGLIVLAGLGVLWATLRTPSLSSCSEPHDHNQHLDHGVCLSCGHSHMPDAEKLADITSLKAMAAIVFAVGVRPCTGAVLMLILALTHGILAAGLVATFAMSLGTAVTVSILAALTVSAKKGLLKLFSGHSRMASLVAKGLGILAGVFIVIIGLTLFFATTSKPFI